MTKDRTQRKVVDYFYKINLWYNIYAYRCRGYVYAFVTKIYNAVYYITEIDAYVI